MTHYIKYYVNNAEINDVMNALDTLHQKRLINKFAKSIGISAGGLSDIILRKRELSACTLTVYNKIVSNIDTFLENENKQKEILSIVKDMNILPDMLDIWVDKNGCYYIEARGMEPADNMVNKKRYIGFIDDGTVTFE